MNRKYFLTLIAIFYITLSFAQNSLNAYKYIIVPKTYDFLKEQDKYRLNSLTRHLFSKKGFETLYVDETYPAELIENPCLALSADLVDKSGMFTSKLSIELTDCHNKVVFTSIQGKSKEKDYEGSFQEALRNAFTSIDKLDYNFVPESVVNTSIAAQTLTRKETPESTTIQATTAPVTAAAPTTVTSKKSIAKSYKDENISFFLIEQNNSLIAYVNESKNNTYQKGEMIATLKKTSLPNIYRINWKNDFGKFEDTTGYFDEEGNLKIDFNIDGKIEVKEYKIEN